MKQGRSSLWRVARSRVVPILVCLSLTTGVAAAAGLTAAVDRSEASRGDQVLLTITLTGESRDLPAPDLPAIAGVTVSRGGTSQNFQMINGAVSTSVAWTYYLRIDGDQDVQVPAFEVEVDGEKVSSKAITIRVVDKGTEGSGGLGRTHATSSTGTDAGAPGPGDDHFVTLTVDRDTAYVGEQVVLIFRYHANPYARGLDRPQYTPPRTEGFWREDLPPNRNYQDVIDGQRYEITEIRYALFPTRPGVLTIEPARVTIPADPFADFFSSRRRRSRSAPRELSTGTVEIMVQALPLPRPAGFSGLVSRQVDLTATVNLDTVPRGEPVSLSLSLGADGSLKSISELSWQAPENVQSHEAGGGLDTRKDHGRMFSRLTQERVLIPLEEGPLDLPPVEVVYFDPSSDTYASVSRNLGTLFVQAGVRPVAGDSPSRVLRAEIERLANDLRFAHPVTRSLRTRRAPLTANPIWWAALLAPVVLLGVLRFQLSREASRLRDPLGTRRRGAWRRARSVLRVSRRDGRDPDVGARIVGAVYGFVADKTGRSPAGMRSSHLLEYATRIGRVETGEGLVDLVTRCEAVRYGLVESEQSGPDLAKEAESLLAKLEAAAVKAPAVVLKCLLVSLMALGITVGDEVSAQDVGTGPGADPMRLMAEGVRAYTDGDLIEAVARFEATAAVSHDADVYYNLGNTRARRGELGHAVANYLRASRLAPRDPDIRANLAWVRSHTRDIELEGAPPPPVIRHLGAILGALSLDEFCLLLIAALWLAALVIAWAWWRTGWTPVMRRWGLVSGFILLAILANSAWRWYDQRVKDVAVVVVAEVDVRSGPEESFPVVFQVHDGLTLQVKASRDDWSQVTLGGEWDGWLPTAALTHVRLRPERD